jgi:endonuclease/exonuclease/phosphatase family metal-dependent hydrolase
MIGCAAVTNYPDPLGPMLSGVALHQPSYSGKELTVVTYNINLGANIDQAIAEIEQDSILCEADFFLLQEMNPAGVERIAAHFDLNYLYYPAAIHSRNNKDFGNAILSRWPLAAPAKVILPHTDPLRDQIRIATAATARIGERDIRVVSTHTEMYRLRSSARREQIDSLGRSIATGSRFVIIGGDFNTVRGDVLESFDDVFERYDLTRATVGIGPTARSDPFGILPLSLDHIYVRGFVVTGNGKVDQVRASDHKPVWVSLRFGKTI